MEKAVFRFQGALWLGLACLGTLAGCQVSPRAPAPGPAVARQSNKTDRKSLAVTVYNQDFGVVRESRHVKLAPGRVELSFKDVSSSIQPETVRLRSASPGAALQVLEQNYRYDLLTPQNLLEKYVGKSISVYRYDERTGTEEKKTAEVLSVQGGVTLRIDGEVTSLAEAGRGIRFGFAEVPANLLEKPTLVWLLESDRAEQDVEVTYATGGLGWSADYVLKLDADSTRADLNGWVTLHNRSGASYENAELRLVAGNVNRRDPNAYRYAGALDLADRAEAPKPQFREEALFEYHQYTLGRPTTLLDAESKQVALLSAEGVKVAKKLVFGGQPELFRGRYPQAESNQKVAVFVELQNSEQNHLGMPLPKGTVRLYQADASGALQFIGEDEVDHTPRDEKVSLKVGEAFDVIGERTQKDWTQLGNCSAESSYEVELRNHKDAEVQVQVNEPAGVEWQVLSSSLPFTKVDAGTFRFDVKVPAHGATKLTYRVRVRYC